MKTTLLFFVLLGVVCVSPAQAAVTKQTENPAGKSAQGKAPLSDRLLAAKTMCIKVRLAPKAGVAEAQSELKSWGRFKVMEDCTQAEVTLWIQARVIPEFETCGALIQVTANSDGSILWTGTNKCKKSTKGMVGQLVRAMRKDIASAEAPNKSQTPNKSKT